VIVLSDEHRKNTGLIGRKILSKVEFDFFLTQKCFFLFKKQGNSLFRVKRSLMRCDISAIIEQQEEKEDSGVDQSQRGEGK
jgi:hypothetical protein